MKMPPLGCLSCSGDCTVRFELPCIRTTDGKLCDCKDPSPRPIIFPGDSEVVYDVPIHVRGMIEAKGYTGGTNAHDWIVFDATPVANTFNIYYLQLIGDTPYKCYLNRQFGQKNSSIYNDNYGYYPADYHEVIPIRGGSCVKLVALTIDRRQLANYYGDPICSSPDPSIPTFPDVCAIRPPLEPGLIIPPQNPNQTIYCGQFLQVDMDCTVALPAP